MKDTLTRPTRRPRALLALLPLLWPCALLAQQGTQAADSGSIVVDRHYAIVNVDNIPADSMLYIESFSVDAHVPTDTVFMRRWFAAANLARVEVTYHGHPVAGMQSDGKTLFRTLDTARRAWEGLPADRYHIDISGYDFRGPLYRWRTDGSELYYQGEWEFEGHRVRRVFVMSPNRYDRNYLFEKESGLLFFVDERDTHSDNMATGDGEHVRWRAYHEYTPLGTSLYVSQESFMKDNVVTVTYHTYRLLPRSSEPFVSDQITLPRP